MSGQGAENDGAAVVSDALDEWLFRMHGLTSSCDHATEARGILDALTAAGFRVTPTGGDSGCDCLSIRGVTNHDPYCILSGSDARPLPPGGFDA